MLSLELIRDLCSLHSLCSLNLSKNGKGVIVLNFAVYCIQLARSHLQHTRLRTMVNGLTYSKTKQLFMCMQTIKINYIYTYIHFQNKLFLIITKHSHKFIMCPNTLKNFKCPVYRKQFLRPQRNKST